MRITSTCNTYCISIFIEFHFCFTCVNGLKANRLEIVFEFTQTPPPPSNVNCICKRLIVISNYVYKNNHQAVCNKCSTAIKLFVTSIYQLFSSAVLFWYTISISVEGFKYIQTISFTLFFPPLVSILFCACRPR